MLAFFLILFVLSINIDFFVSFLRKAFFHVFEICYVLDTVILVNHVFLIELKEIHELYKYICVGLFSYFLCHFFSTGLFLLEFVVKLSNEGAVAMGIR